MDSDAALSRLPRTYALALRLRQVGADQQLIADCLDIELQAVGPLLSVADAKLSALHASQEADR
ncbi:MAG TPA: hypothetical protein VLL25_07145 [Acidimicrobiales bacterium]|nr:hypothetical protein [Acidimicrobiales bacterium]